MPVDECLTAFWQASRGLLVYVPSAAMSIVVGHCPLPCSSRAECNNSYTKQETRSMAPGRRTSRQVSSPCGQTLPGARLNTRLYHYIYY